MIFSFPKEVIEINLSLLSCVSKDDLILLYLGAYYNIVAM